MKILTLAALALLSGCAINSGIVTMGPDTYFVSRQGAATYGMANLKGEALGEAGQFCSARNKTVQVLTQVDAQPPFILGNYPKTEITFKCV